jgi:hypothetical protein
MKLCPLLGFLGVALLACGGSTDVGSQGGAAGSAGATGGSAGATGAGGSAGISGDSGVACTDDGGSTLAQAGRVCAVDSDCQIGVARACCGADYAFGLAKAQAATYGACFAVSCPPGLGCAKYLGYRTDTGATTTWSAVGGDAIGQVRVLCKANLCTTDVVAADAAAPGDASDAPSPCFDSYGKLVSTAKACTNDGDCDMLATATCCGPSTIVGIAKSASAYAACYPVPQNCPPLGCASQATTEDGRPAPSGVASAIVHCIARDASPFRSCITSHNPDAG